MRPPVGIAIDERALDRSRVAITQHQIGIAGRAGHAIAQIPEQLTLRGKRISRDGAVLHGALRFNSLDALAH